MTSGTVNSVVPNDLDQARIVYNMHSARNQIDDMVVIAGNNMTKALFDAQISPSERAYLYLKVQEKLKFDLDSVRDLVGYQLKLLLRGNNTLSREITYQN